jgi:hypothetical protein
LTPQRGQVAVFAEADYCYGLGPLTLRIQGIDWSAPVWYDGENWYQVSGVEVDANGKTFGHRQVLVRGRRLSSPPGPRGS